MQLRCMTRLFAKAVGAQAPGLSNMDADGMLHAFTSFTVQETARLAGTEAGDAARADLRRRAYNLGRRLAAMPPFSGIDRFELVQALYRNIDITLEGALPGQITMCPCSFSTYYAPSACLFMSAFDEGIMAGIVGEGALTFSCRITEGAPCCTAAFEQEGILL
ncbi:hypothetical protein Shel_23810 [Slackia heliotrinireducens DSM 20476]|uniref:Uncharacterized protein n=2 Tax=Slackia TaxID=84108 RepID=C7N1U9_SLAHD|nr:hypothetical protein Shel_23810 [Slackia heliotrinireducens DSM 20476]